MSRQYQTPLFTGLLEHARRNPVQFHIPGHKQGAGMAPDFREFIGKQALSIDLINIAPVDDLQNPRGIIREAQEIAAEAFGAGYTFFSVQGTSCAIMAMILSVCRPGDRILLPRNIHKSVLAGIVLSGADPVFMTPDLDDNFGIAHGVSPCTVRESLEAHPDVKGVLVINPTYYGMATDLRTIVALAHARGIPVLVDEAHGAHLHFHAALPPSAMEAGADMAATSVHKLGGSMTQTSVLNVRGDLVNPRRVKTAMSMLTTTSTSYLLLASLDVARKQLATVGAEMIDRALQLAGEARAAINRIPGLYCFGAEILRSETARFSHDPTKLLIMTRDLGITGIEMETLLRAEFRVEVELSDLYNILCVVSLGDTTDALNHLVGALKTIAGRFYQGTPASPIKVHLPTMPILGMSPREAFFARTEAAPLEEADGEVIAESIMVYPPGIPIFLPGEVISRENIAYIRECQQAGLPVQGAEDETLRLVNVVRG